MIPIEKSYRSICSILGVTPKKVRSLGGKKSGSFTKRIIQVILRNHYGKNASYDEIAALMGLNVATVYQGIDAAQMWLKVDYEEFSIPFRKAEKRYLKWVIGYYSKQYEAMTLQ